MLLSGKPFGEIGRIQQHPATSLHSVGSFQDISLR